MPLSKMSTQQHNSTTSPSQMEAGLGYSSSSHHHHHHPGHSTARRMRHLAHGHRDKHEIGQLRMKLPGFAHSNDTNLKKLRMRLIIKNEIVAAVAEFVGTFLFLFFAFGIATQSNHLEQTLDKNQNGGMLDTSQLMYISLGFGFSLAVNAWVFFRISGGLFNPAVTFGLFLTGTLTWYRSIILCIVQFAAAISAAGIAQVLIPHGIDARTKLGDDTTIAQGFFIEMFCTALLMFAIYMLAGEKHKATFLAPIGIGLALFLTQLFAVPLTGASLNPARSLGPDVIAAEFNSSTWIYYTAPFAGTLASAIFYWGLKASHYETTNEGQDGADDEDVTLVLRDNHGNVTGAAKQVNPADAAVARIPALQHQQQDGEDDRSAAQSVVSLRDGGDGEGKEEKGDGMEELSTSSSGSGR